MTDSRALRTEVTDSAGVQIVRNSGAGDTLVLEPDLVIGTVDGPEEFQFFGVLDIAVLHDGSILVSDRSGMIREFSPAGEHVRSVGRRGSGPGEFEWPSSIHVYGDTIAVFDGQLDRFTELSTTGELLGTVPLSPRVARLSPVARVDGSWLMRSYPIEWHYEVGRETRDTTRLVRIDAADVARLDSPGAVPLHTVVAYESGSRWGVPYADGGGTVAEPLWQPPREYAVDGSGNTHVSHGLPYRIDVRDADGELWRVIEREHRPVRMSDALNDRYWQKVEAWLDTAHWSAHELEVETAALRGRADLPAHDHLPALGRLVVSADGMIWAQRLDLLEDPLPIEWTRERVRQDTFWDVFDHEGRFIATVRLPAGFRAVEAADRSIYGVLRDDLDVEHIARFTLPGPPL